MKIYPLTLALAICASLPADALEWSLNQEKVEIYVPEAASASERYAAEELQSYLKRMSGVEVAIRPGSPEEGSRAVIIGRHPLNEDLWQGLDDPDRYRIDAAGDRVRVAGGYRPPATAGDGEVYPSDRGVLYGVYELLEEQGVRWLRPGPRGEEVPKGATLKVADGLRNFQPAFPLRWGVALYATSANRSATEEETDSAVLWALRNRCNVFRGNDPRFGGSLKIGGSGHAYNYLVPRSLFKEKPEFFPLIDGKRQQKGQICQGNPELQEYFANAVVRKARENPQWFMTSIDPNDGGGWCECDLCQAMDDPNLKSGRSDGLSMSPRMAAFNNIIAEKVAKALPELPNLRLYCLAYSQYTETPTNVEKLADNLVIGVAPFAGAYSDYSRPLRDPESLPNSRFLASIQGFHKLGTTLYAREYLSHYIWPGPLPLLWVMQDRFQEYRKYGFIGAYSETHPCWGPQGMVLYFYLKLLWNPDLDLQTAMADYCEKAYGPAAAPMLRYHQKIEERGKGGPYFGSGGSQAINLFTDEFLATLVDDVTEARKLSVGAGDYEWRTETTLKGFDFARLYRRAVNQLAEGDPEKARAAIEEVERFFRDHSTTGDVFNKGEGHRKNAKGEAIIESTFRMLHADLARIDTLDRTFENPRLLQQLNAAWRFQTDAEGEGIPKGWHLAETDDTQWPRINSGSAWQHQGYSGYTGTAWYRRKLPTPKIGESQRMMLIFDGVDGDATVWLNGQEIGKRALIHPEDGRNLWNEPFALDVTKAFIADQANTLVVRVRKDDGNGGLYRGVRLIRVDGKE